MIHELKTLPEFFKAVRSGEKTFEVRKDDRGFKVGDDLILREWSPRLAYHGPRIHRRVAYILRGEEWGIREGYCVLGFEKEPS